METQANSSSQTLAVPAEVGGWLLVFCLILTIAYPATSLIVIFSHTVPTAISARTINRMLLLSVYSGAFGILALLSLVAGLKLWLIKPHAVRFARRYLLTYLATNTAYFIFWIAIIRPNTQAAYLEMGYYHVVTPVASFALWWSYLEHSKRVRDTYPVQ